MLYKGRAQKAVIIIWTSWYRQEWQDNSSKITNILKLSTYQKVQNLQVEQFTEALTDKT